jgi:ribokinase
VTQLMVRACSAIITVAAMIGSVSAFSLRSLPLSARQRRFVSCPMCTPQMRDVVVVGSCNYDEIAYVPDFPMPGETLFGTSYDTCFGGKGANQCAMAAKLGASTAFIGAVGDDSIGALTRENFRALNVDTSCLVEKPGARSGVAQICVSQALGQNTIIVVPGANLQLGPADVAAARELILQSKVLLLQNEIPPATTLAAMKCAKSEGSGTLVVLNAAPAPSTGSKWEQGEWEDPGEMIGLCDILCVNESEAEKLTGLKIETGSSEERLMASVIGAYEKLRMLGASQVLITLGASGAILVQNDGTHERVPAPTPPITAIDTSGAGDAYLGAFAAYVAAGKSIVEALVLAGEIAGMTVQALGTQPSYPALEQLPRRLRPELAILE